MNALEPPLTVTSAAAARLKRMLERAEQSDVVVRIAVKGGGCSGFEYALSLDPPRPNDICWTVDGVTLALDPRAEKFLRGATLDADRNLLGGGLKWDNPNAEKSCGCGTSFTPSRTG